MDIVACTDRRFVMPTGVMMYSVCINHDTDITFHVITDDSVTDADKASLAGTVAPFKGKTVTFYTIEPEKLSVDLPMGLRRPELTRATYYRLWLTEILPAEIDKVLYLDGDIIVRSSLLPLWDIDLSGYALGAVPDMSEAVMDKYGRLGYAPELGYFNAGVLMVNLDYWRRNAVVQEFMAMLMHRPEDLHCHDQDVLNYCFREAKLNLSIKYNVQDGFLYEVAYYDYRKYKQQVAEARRSPVIIHYTHAKPWWTYSRHVHPWRNSFFAYREHTIWKDKPLVEMRPWQQRWKKRIALLLRKYGIIPELPPNGYEYLPLPPVD